MSKVFVFAGTTEGRKLFELLKKNNISCTVSVATDYGANLLSENSKCKVLSGRMSKEDMVSAVKKSKCLCLVDILVATLFADSLKSLDDAEEYTELMHTVRNVSLESVARE